MQLHCIDCDSRYSISDFKYACSCGGLLEIEQDFKFLDSEYLKRKFEQRLSDRMTPYASGVWRYKELIFPELEDRFLITKNEGNTGLYDIERVNQYVGIKKIWLKSQSENPSGSFKDNGMVVAVSHGKSLGLDKFTCTSTGNTSSSLAMYSSLTNSQSYVFVPDKNISLNKVLQTISYGAKVIAFEGTYDQGIDFLEKYSGELGLYICNSINPFRIEGQKSIIYEIAQYLRWELPDWIVVPGGALSNVSALGKGLGDLYELGFINRLPRVAVVQAEGASPFHQMISKNKNELQPELQPKTVASALNIGNPPSWKKARNTLNATNGITVSVTDDEILNAKAVIDQSGIGCEPASASTVAGLKKLCESGQIHRDETAVCILTGNLLKDTEVLRQYHLECTENSLFANPLIKSKLNIESIKHL
ncbi:threonine synthase [Paenibacillus sp. GCM10012307]|uniref:Threonine synthase n=1 Tax=Paenibacillus roseus TaxID=2798579 RepID=A0A934JA31_9BACL|nr:threonine synthase [Paenibacillus roseus]MBJ6363217.1 threonine synthase [Paenibacillus roseus]